MCRADGQFLLKNEPDRLIRVSTVIGEDALPLYKDITIEWDGRQYITDIVVSLKPKGRNLISRRIISQTIPQCFTEIFAAESKYLDEQLLLSDKYVMHPPIISTEDNFTKQKRIYFGKP